MGISGMASVQSRIAAIEGRIAAISGGGRPPVAITESGAVAGAKTSAVSGANRVGATTSTTGVDTAARTDFSQALRTQMSRVAPTTSTPTTGAGKLQGVPGTAEAFVTKLKTYLGVPYVWGGTDPQRGLDCSGLVQLAAREVGVNLPRVTWDQQKAGQEISSIEQAKPGDLLITRGGAHIAVFLGEGQAIHAPRPGKVVEITSVANLGPIKTIRRVMPSAEDANAAVVNANRAGLGNSNISGALGALNSPGAQNLNALGASLGLRGLDKAGLNPQQIAQVAGASTQLAGLNAINNPAMAQSLLGQSASSLLGA